MIWELVRDGDVVVGWMTGTKANVQNDVFIDDLCGASDRLERDFADCAVAR